MASKPLGVVTRGTTNPNRLRKIDRWLIHTYCASLRAQDHPLVVDLGYGASPRTTVELVRRLREAVSPEVRVLGLEIDPERVALAQAIDEPGLRFALGGFEVPTEQTPIIIRAANVLRQYPVESVEEHWSRLLARCTHAVIDATCDELGRLGSWLTLEPGRGPVTFTISMQVGAIEQPSDVAARLPKALIHRNQPGEPIGEFLAQLDALWRKHAPLATFGPRQRWIATVSELAETGVQVIGGPGRWRLGELTVPASYCFP